MLSERFVLRFVLSLTILLLGYVAYLFSTSGCVHDCIQLYGSRSCNEYAVYDFPRCYGPIVCRPADCQTLRGPTHVVKPQCIRGSLLRDQHVTYIALDCNWDGSEDTYCEAWHSCLKKPTVDVE
ncbi:MAG: hypothetical protein RMK94_16300 [Armatimonadota bacterium]|nr:hypothetical protein [Armatimonadota bacterium]